MELEKKRPVSRAFLHGETYTQPVQKCSLLDRVCANEGPFKPSLKFVSIGSGIQDLECYGFFCQTRRRAAYHFIENTGEEIPTTLTLTDPQHDSGLED